MFEGDLILWKELIISTLVIGISLLALIPLMFKIGGKISPFTYID